MTSDLAKVAVEEMWAAGLHPSVEDIVRLNALALKAERGINGDGFASVPRVAFLGDDLVLQEPTIGKLLWLEFAREIIGNDYHDLIALTAFVLNKPANELPPCDSPRKIKKAVRKFYEEVLILFTETEIVAKCAYCINGHTEDTNESPEPSKRVKVDEVPDVLISAVRAVVGDLVREGAQYDSVLKLTLAQAEGMRVRMLIAKHGDDGRQLIKDYSLGEFYRTADAIKERLKNGNE